MSNQVPSDNITMMPLPKRKTKVKADEFRSELNKETNKALHLKKIYLIENCLWIIPLLVAILVIVIVDLCITLLVWKNPTILFEQIKTVATWIVAYILGLVTDHIRRMISK